MGSSTAVRPDLRPALQFLSRLSKNNTRDWFEQNREHYETAMEEFGILVGQLITGLGKGEDLDGVTPKDCIMRIFRDVRFSKDKSPYKTGLGAGIVSGGRKSGRIGYHVHLQPGGRTMVGGGMWEPAPQQLSKFRSAISKDAGDFRKIMESSGFKRHFGELVGEQVKTAPQGYAADHPQIDLLRYKQVCVMERFDDDVVSSPTFPTLAVQSLTAMKPFIDFLNKITLE
ncbi:MAG: DUF2461 domain-containing protein [Spirochaetia bacterium]